MIGRERAEEKPQEPEEGFSAVFELARVGAVIHDSTGRALRVNPKMYDITGYSENTTLVRREGGTGPKRARFGKFRLVSS